MGSRRYKDWIYPAGVILLAYTVFHFVGIGCPIRFVSGISCPGCGMTRAWLAVLRLDFAVAFYYHPLFFLPPVALAVWFLKSKINLKIYKIIMLTMAALFITIYLLRLVLNGGEIVVFEPQNNIIFRLLRHERK